MIDWLINGGWIIVCSVCGLVMTFQEPLPKRKPPPSAKRKAKRTAKRTVQPKKPMAKKGQDLSKANKPREWAKMHKPDAAEIWRVEEMFRRGRS